MLAVLSSDFGYHGGDVMGVAKVLNRMRKMMQALCISVAFAPQSVFADTVSVFAAASMGGVLTDVGAAFREQTGHDVILVTAGSSTLARQIENGAPADVFVSANQAWVTYLEQAGIGLARSRRDIANNALVLVTSDPDVAPLSHVSALELTADDFVAMAMVDAIPAGIMAKPRWAISTVGTRLNHMWSKRTMCAWPCSLSPWAKQNTASYTRQMRSRNRVCASSIPFPMTAMILSSILHCN